MSFYFKGTKDALGRKAFGLSIIIWLEQFCPWTQNIESTFEKFLPPTILFEVLDKRNFKCI